MSYEYVLNVVPKVNLNYPIRQGRDFELIMEVPIEWKTYTFRAVYKDSTQGIFSFDILKSDNDIVTTLRLSLNKEVTANIAPTKKGLGELIVTNLDGKTYTVMEILVDTVCPPTKGVI